VLDRPKTGMIVYLLMNGNLELVEEKVLTLTQPFDHSTIQSNFGLVVKRFQATR
ncbi:1593_t:CDS:1, partial [Acaulospora colombiana]